MLDEVLDEVIATTNGKTTPYTLQFLIVPPDKGMADLDILVNYTNPAIN